jgi:hypothetical protein
MWERIIYEGFCKPHFLKIISHINFINLQRLALRGIDMIFSL